MILLTKPLSTVPFVPQYMQPQTHSLRISPDLHILKPEGLLTVPDDGSMLRLTKEGSYGSLVNLMAVAKTRSLLRAGNSMKRKKIRPKE